MEHEDGYCDGCGCELPGVAQLTVSGHELCLACSTSTMLHTVQVAKRPEARDDGR